MGSQCELGQLGKGQEEGDQVVGHPSKLVVGLSCCDKPASLGAIWAAHSSAALTAISSLEGVHGELVDYKGEVVEGSIEKLLINQTEVMMKIDSGHFWLLLPAGQHTLSVGEVTQPVTVMPGELAMVVFEVEKKGMSWLVLFSILATGLGISYLVLTICRKHRRGFKGSKVGFQKLTDKSE